MGADVRHQVRTHEVNSHDSTLAETPLTNNLTNLLSITQALRFDPHALNEALKSCGGPIFCAPGQIAKAVVRNTVSYRFV